MTNLQDHRSHSQTGKSHSRTMGLKLPGVEQSRRRPQVLEQVGTGSRHEVLDTPSGNTSEMGVAPQGQVMTLQGSKGQERHVPSWQGRSHR